MKEFVKGLMIKVVYEARLVVAISKKPFDMKLEAFHA